MNTEERDLITKFVARVGGAPQGGFGSVPATAPNLPAIDPEADNYIGQMFQQYPEARYRVTQMAVVQEAALVAAQNRIQQLQWQLQQAQQALQAQQEQSRPAGGGLFGGLFGGGQRPQGAPPPGWGGQQAAPPPPQPPQPAYPQGMQPGMFPARGSGFLGSALTTAAGVAGGMMVGNALTDLFSGHHDAGGFGGGMPGGGETIINNNYGDAASAPGADPFGGAGTDVDPGFDAGGDSGFGGGDWGGGGDDNF
jgi:uncharacterized protein